MTRRSEDSVATRAHSLNRAEVVTAALILVDQDGPQAVTMRAIARRLGVRAQSLYTHIDSRHNLFEAVADRIVDEIDNDLDTRHVSSDPWQNYLADTARAVRRYTHHHPNAFVLLATFPAHTSPLLSQRWMETFLSSLERTGFNIDEAAFACRAFDAFLLGSLLLETRDLSSQPGETGTCPPIHLRNPDPPQVRARPRSFQEPVPQHDDDFASALDNVIDRISNRVKHRAHSACKQSDHAVPCTAH